MQLQSFTFEGHALPVITLDGRPAWLARDVGRVLGYAEDGARLIKNFKASWASELLEGVDYRVVAGQELKDLRSLPYVGTEPVTSSSPVGTDSEPTSEGGASFFLDPKAPSATFLFESGLNLVCLLSRKPLGKALRRFLATEVMPALARGELGGMGSPTEEDSVAGELTDLERAMALKEVGKLMALAGGEAQARGIFARVAQLLDPDLVQDVPKHPPYKGNEKETGKRGAESEPQISLTFTRLPRAFPGGRPDPDATLRLLADDFADLEPVPAEDWVDRLERAGLGRFVKSSTPRGKATRAGIFFRPLLGQEVNLGGRALVFSEGWSDDAPRRRVVGFFLKVEAESLN